MAGHPVAMPAAASDSTIILKSSTEPEYRENGSIDYASANTLDAV
jgi:hypothetical protein